MNKKLNISLQNQFINKVNIYFSIYLSNNINNLKLNDISSNKNITDNSFLNTYCDNQLIINNYLNKNINLKRGLINIFNYNLLTLLLRRKTNKAINMVLNLLEDKLYNYEFYNLSFINSSINNNLNKFDEYNSNLSLISKADLLSDNITKILLIFIRYSIFSDIDNKKYHCYNNNYIKDMFDDNKLNIIDFDLTSNFNNKINNYNNSYSYTKITEKEIISFFKEYELMVYNSNNTYSFPIVVFNFSLSKTIQKFLINEIDLINFSNYSNFRSYDMFHYMHTIVYNDLYFIFNENDSIIDNVNYDEE